MFAAVVAVPLSVGTAVSAAMPQDETRLLTGHEAGVTRLAMSADGLYLASASLDHTVRLWDPDSGECLRVFQGHTDEVYAVAFSADSVLVGSTGNDRSVRVQEAESGEVVMLVKAMPSWGLSLSFSPDGGQVAVGCADGTTRLFAVATGEPAGEIPGRGTVETVAFDPEGRWLALGGSGIRLVDVDTRKVVRQLQGHEAKVAELCFSSDGAMVASASHDRTARVWNPETGESLFTFRCEVPVGAYVGQEGVGGGVTLGLPLTSVAFSSGGDLLAVGGAGRAAWVWDIATGKQQRLVVGFTRSVTGVAFGPEDGALFTACLEGIIARHPPN